MNGALEAAWDAVREALPARWRVGSPSFDPAGDGRWSVTAVGGRSIGRGKIPRSVSGTGSSEADALRDLDDRLRGVPKPDGTRIDELRRRLRLSYVEGAETWTRENVGRGLPHDELGRIISQYPARNGGGKRGLRTMDRRDRRRAHLVLGRPAVLCR